MKNLSFSSYDNKGFLLLAVVRSKMIGKHIGYVGYKQIIINIPPVINENINAINYVNLFEFEFS